MLLHFKYKTFPGTPHKTLCNIFYVIESFFFSGPGGFVVESDVKSFLVSFQP